MKTKSSTIPMWLKITTYINTSLFDRENYTKFVRKLLNNGIGSFSLNNLHLRRISNTASLFNDTVV